MTILFGMFASATLILLSIAVQRKSVVALSIVLMFFTSAQYITLDKWIPVALNALAFIYAMTIPFEKKLPWLTSKPAFATVYAIYTTVFFSMNGFNLNIELLTYLASVTSLALLSIKRPLISKWVMLANGLLWTVYLVAVGAYGQIPGEIMFTAGVIFSLFMIYNAKRKGLPESDIPELVDVLRAKFNKTAVDNKSFAVLSYGDKY